MLISVTVVTSLLWIRYVGQDSVSSRLAPLDFEPGVIHVHGLGVDPADGALYAATHSGLFRIPESGDAVRVANRAQDTMGFSVVGPHTFIGSGHPDFREDNVRPPLLGLLESRDAGQTWKRVSLHGEADFHVLRQAHDGRTYGYDSTSGRLLVSSDGRSWDQRAALQMWDFAVSPSDPDWIRATTTKGLVQSLDGGRTFHSVPGPEGVRLLSWTSRGLYAVCSDGAVHLLPFGKVTWVELGTAKGEPEALFVEDREGQQVVYVATMSAGILMSTDGGRSFTTRYRAR